MRVFDSLNFKYAKQDIFFPLLEKRRKKKTAKNTNREISKYEFLGARI